MSESNTRSSRTDHLHNVDTVPQALATEGNVDMEIGLQTGITPTMVVVVVAVAAEVAMEVATIILQLLTLQAAS